MNNQPVAECIHNCLRSGSTQVFLLYLRFVEESIAALTSWWDDLGNFKVENACKAISAGTNKRAYWYVEHSLIKSR
jgi:hypothetical protein